MTREQFIRALLSAAENVGIGEAEVYCLENESMQMLLGKGEIAQYSVNTTGGASLRGLVNGKMGTAYTEAMDDAAVAMLVTNVLQSAELIEDEDKQFLYDKIDIYHAVDCTGDLGAPDKRIAFALHMERIGRELDPRVSEFSNFSQFGSTHISKRLVNSHGLDLTHTQDWCYAYLEAIARGNGEQVATAGAIEGGRSLSDLSAERIAEKSVCEAISRLSAAPIPSGDRAVILRNDAMGNLLDTFSGVFSAEAAQKGLSLLAGKEGELIASQCVTLTDDPLMNGGIATSPFDDEGVATFTKNIVESGLLTTLLHNLKTANKAGVRSTGNASRGGISAPVTVSASNFYIRPGEPDLLQLETQMRNGLVITELEGLHAGTDSISGDFSLLCRGYVVSEGLRGGAVERVTVAGNFFSLLKDIIAVGSDLVFEMSNVGSPSVLVTKLSIAGD
ncbi:MAG: TldD/PmbA family protein [Clostridia bacterium]|nr:TldD/PmbA family protein [Clostridia bacterium]